MTALSPKAQAIREIGEAIEALIHAAKKHGVFLHVDTTAGVNWTDEEMRQLDAALLNWRRKAQ